MVEYIHFYIDGILLNGLIPNFTFLQETNKTDLILNF